MRWVVLHLWQLFFPFFVLEDIIAFRFLTAKDRKFAPSKHFGTWRSLLELTPPPSKLISNLSKRSKKVNSPFPCILNILIFNIGRSQNFSLELGCSFHWKSLKITKILANIAENVPFIDKLWLNFRQDMGQHKFHYCTQSKWKLHRCEALIYFIQLLWKVFGCFVRISHSRLEFIFYKNGAENFVVARFLANFILPGAPIISDKICKKSCNHEFLALFL